MFNVKIVTFTFHAKGGTQTRMTEFMRLRPGMAMLLELLEFATPYNIAANPQHCLLCTFSKYAASG